MSGRGGPQTSPVAPSTGETSVSASTAAPSSRSSFTLALPSAVPAQDTDAPQAAVDRSRILSDLTVDRRRNGPPRSDVDVATHRSWQ